MYFQFHLILVNVDRVYILSQSKHREKESKLTT